MRPSERCVPDVRRHCAGQQCDILFHTPRRLHGHNTRTVATTPLSDSSQEIQRRYCTASNIKNGVSACSAILGWGVGGSGGDIVQSYFCKQSHQKRNGIFWRSSSLSELSRDEKRWGELHRVGFVQATSDIVLLAESLKNLKTLEIKHHHSKNCCYSES